jgi:ABC-type multidrug transport system fused ATPase/permease subunit
MINRGQAVKGAGPWGAGWRIFSDLSRLLEITSKPAWATPTLVTLGLLSALAETLGVTLIIAFFAVALGRSDAEIVSSGLLGEAVRFATSSLGSSTRVAVAIFLLIVLRGLLSFTYNVVSASVSENISQSARELLHKQLLSASYAFFRRHNQAQLMEVLGTQSWMIAGAYVSLTRIIVNSCSIVAFSIFLLLVSWKIALFAIAGSAIISFGLRWLKGPAHAFGERAKEVHRQLAEQMLVTLQGMRTIRAYGDEKVHQRRFELASSEAKRISIAWATISASLNPLMEIGYLGILCGVIVAANIWQFAFVTTLAAVALLYRLQPHVRELEGNLLGIAQVQPQLSSVRIMLEATGKEQLATGVRPISLFADGVSFRNVTFRYEARDEPALVDVSFEIPAGKTTALVGPSGAGKTTIINLLLRLYEPSSGCILVDGVAMSELERSAWLKLVAVAGQDIDLIEGTVIENIRMADHDASDESVVAAARLAGVSEFIEGLPEAYDTWVGQEGMRFSGGQRQRLGLARALLRDPQLLMLDEAMSALDQKHERRIRSVISESFAGRTTVIVTHRIESVLGADRIVCISRGRVVAEGDPNTLLKDPNSALSQALERASSIGD